MATAFDRVTIERLRCLPAPEVVVEVRKTLRRVDSVGSEDFLELYDQLVEEGVLTWADVEGVD